MSKESLSKLKDFFDRKSNRIFPYEISSNDETQIIMDAFLSDYPVEAIKSIFNTINNAEGEETAKERAAYLWSVIFEVVKKEPLFTDKLVSVLKSNINEFIIPITQGKLRTDIIMQALKLPELDPSIKALILENYVQYFLTTNKKNSFHELDKSILFEINLNLIQDKVVKNILEGLNDKAVKDILEECRKAQETLKQLLSSFFSEYGQGLNVNLELMKYNNIVYYPTDPTAFLFDIDDLRNFWLTNNTHPLTRESLSKEQNRIIKSGVYLDIYLYILKKSCSEEEIKIIFLEQEEQQAILDAIRSLELSSERLSEVELYMNNARLDKLQTDFPGTKKLFKQIKELVNEYDLINLSQLQVKQLQVNKQISSGGGRRTHGPVIGSRFSPDRY